MGSNMESDRVNHVRPQAVVAGHICLDITPNFPEGENKELKDILSPGKLTKMEGVKLSTGGTVANTGIALSILGIDTRLMGKVGNDAFGDVVINILREHDVQEGMRIVDGARTSYTVILVPPGTDRIFLHDPGANDDFGAEDIDYELMKEAGIFHFGYPPVMRRTYLNGGQELIRLFKRVKELGTTTSLDMCVPDPFSEAGRVDWDKLLRELLPFVDIYVPSIEETLYMIDREYFQELNRKALGRDLIEVLDMNRLPLLGEKLLGFGAKIVMIKCGKKGIYIKTASRSELDKMGRARPADLDNWSLRELLEETYHVPKVLSTTGAGDTSIAGFLAAFLKGMSIEDSVAIACGTGSECVEAYDALSGIKPLEKTLDMIRSGWRKDRITVEGGYWKYLDNRSVWVGQRDCVLRK